MSNKHIIALILVLITVALFGWQHVIELRSEEPRRAIVSLEMLLSGEYVVPKINGWAYYNKPPLFNWVMAGFFALFGTNEWVVRLPSLLAICCIALSFYFFGKKYVSKEKAILGSLLFITAGEVLFYGSVISGEIDFFYSLLIVFQALSMFHFYQNRNWKLLYLVSYIFMALGFLTKGLPSLAFQFFTLIALALTFKDWKFLFKWQHLTGGLVGLFMIVGYLFIYDQKGDVIGFLVRQTKEAGMKSSLESSFLEIIREFFLFPFNYLKLLLPWSLFLFLLNKKARRMIWLNPLLRFSFWFILCNILIYWFAGSFGHRYVYMFLPFTCILLTQVYIEVSNQYKNILNKFFKWIVMLSPALFLGALVIEPNIINIESALFKCIIFIALLGLCIYTVVKKKNILLSTILFLAVLRIGFNMYYLPILQETGRAMYYRDACNEILAITGDSQIFITGEPYTFNSRSAIGPFQVDKVLTTAPLIPYKIPYYISRSNLKVLLYDPVIRSGRYYLIPEENHNNEEVLFEIEDDWHKKKLLLIKT